MNTESMVIFKTHFGIHEDLYHNTVLGFSGTIEQAKSFAKNHNFLKVEIYRRKNGKDFYQEV